jgi:hypothetical protein
MKKCTRCGTNKAEEDYHWKKKGSRRQSWCKKCVSEYQSTPERRAKNNKSVQKYGRTEHGRIKNRARCAKFRATAKFKKAMDKYRTNNPEKRSAQIKLANAIAAGKIVRPTSCSVCNIECSPQGHHYDYSLPLSVIWVCVQCHANIHW